MKTLVVVLTAFSLALLSPPATGQTTHTLAVPEFIDDSIDGLHISAPRLNTVLIDLIRRRAAGRFVLVDAAAIQAAQRALGYLPRDLISPTRAIQIAQAVGADWIVIGRWERLESEPDEPAPEGSVGVPRFRTGLAVLNIRIIEVGTRRVVLTDSFWAERIGGGFPRPLWTAVLTVLQQAADRIGRL